MVMEMLKYLGIICKLILAHANGGHMLGKGVDMILVYVLCRCHVFYYVNGFESGSKQTLNLQIKGKSNPKP